MRRARKQRGNTIVEMTLVGIPIIFVMISIFEMARVMWVYHTMSHTVREVTRFAAMHGQDCFLPGNNCLGVNTIGNLATRLGPAGSGVGLDPDLVNVTFASGPALGTVTTCLLRDCVTNPATFPSLRDSALGLPVSIAVRFPIATALSMFWPGDQAGFSFAPITLGASSQDFVQY